ncbi:ATP phosphoribosyltransferase regulatory subunit [Chitinivorax sp. B]|uniref:ATP phosphoribosyltransferase regulatory subunit n=1 Tax=Chitinivorax sp. B TaxID=2502235 RepID=UPI0010F83E92|nr:ATP phosphoribosyltransferase regulatory subunit [Chitinivorax sp. B]
MHRWLLPEYIADILPAEARLVEEKRRRVLDLFHSCGYDLVSTPLIEYTESLIGEGDHDLDMRTFKLVDQLSGRQLGLRADIAPQVARLDAHLLNRQGAVRLCYAGSVVQTQPTSLLGSREQLQVGAEIYGHAGIEADLEIMTLLLDCLALLGVQSAQLDIGHAGVYRSLVGHFDLNAEQEQALFAAYQNKDVAELVALTDPLPDVARKAFRSLSELNGGRDVIEQARANLPLLPGINDALDELDRVMAELNVIGAQGGIDLVELRAAHYHNGLVFAAYAEGWPNAIAWGGRYDNVGRQFGRARPATGFSFDLRELIGKLELGDAQKAILAPYAPDDSALYQVIRALRTNNEIVVINLPGHEAHVVELNVDRELQKRGGVWQVVPFGRCN